jgi:gamma-glutamylcyclotransferase (GGCT)/AIG2-like uncharacterized protein YtfP
MGLQGAHQRLMGKHPVFVYGTLKAGETNHHWLAGASCLGRRLLPGVRLHDLGPYPMALLTEDATDVIHGELYAVDAAGLARLDQLEDFPHLYDRSLRALADGRQAWIYHGSPARVRGTPHVPLGDWGSTPVFHYGSNLDPLRLQRRCPLWDGLGLVVRLQGWSWAIDKRSPRYGGCAGIRRQAQSHTWGVVTHLRPSDLSALDHCENVHDGQYQRTLVTVTCPCGIRFQALTYVPGDGFRQDGLRPDADYSAHILAGLAHWPLPKEWRHHLTSMLQGH